MASVYWWSCCKDDLLRMKSTFPHPGNFPFVFSQAIFFFALFPVPRGHPSPNLFYQKYGFLLKPSKLKIQVMDFSKLNCQTTEKWSFKPPCVAFSSLVAPFFFFGIRRFKHWASFLGSPSPFPSPGMHQTTTGAWICFVKCLLSLVQWDLGFLGIFGALSVLHWRGFFPSLPVPGKLLCVLRISNCARRIKAVQKEKIKGAMPFVRL